MKLASRSKRLIAAVLDFLILIGPTFIFMLIFSPESVFSDQEPDMPIIINFLSFSIFFIVIILQIIYLSSSGQTIGKKIEGIQIVNTFSGETGGFVQNLLLRTIVFNIISNLTCGILAIIDILFIFSKDQQCIHDKIAKTTVIDISKN